MDKPNHPKKLQGFLSRKIEEPEPQEKKPKSRIRQRPKYSNHPDRKEPGWSPTLQGSKDHPPGKFKMKSFHSNNPASQPIVQKQSQEVIRIEPIFTSSQPGTAYSGDTMCRFELEPKRISDLWNDTTKSVEFSQIRTQPDTKSIHQWKMFQSIWCSFYHLAHVIQILRTDRNKEYLKNQFLTQLTALTFTFPKLQAHAVHLIGSFRTSAGYCTLNNSNEMCVKLLTAAKFHADDAILRYSTPSQNWKPEYEKAAINYDDDFFFAPDFGNFNRESGKTFITNEKFNPVKIGNDELNFHITKEDIDTYSVEGQTSGYELWKHDLQNYQVQGRDNVNIHDFIVAIQDNKITAAHVEPLFTKQKVHQLLLTEDFIKVFEKARHIYESVCPGIFASSKIAIEPFIASKEGNACQLVEVISETHELKIPFALPKIDMQHGAIFKFCRSTQLCAVSFSTVQTSREEMKTKKMTQDLIRS